jgi:hypothetical protein
MLGILARQHDNQDGTVASSWTLALAEHRACISKRICTPEPAGRALWPNVGMCVEGGL